MLMVLVINKCRFARNSLRTVLRYYTLFHDRHARAHTHTHHQLNNIVAL